MVSKYCVGPLTRVGRDLRHCASGGNESTSEGHSERYRKEMRIKGVKGRDSVRSAVSTRVLDYGCGGGYSLDLLFVIKDR